MKIGWIQGESRTNRNHAFNKYIVRKYFLKLFSVKKSHSLFENIVRLKSWKRKICQVLKTTLCDQSWSNTFWYWRPRRCFCGVIAIPHAFWPLPPPSPCPSLPCSLLNDRSCRGNSSWRGWKVVMMFHLHSYFSYKTLLIQLSPLINCNLSQNLGEAQVTTKPRVSCGWVPFCGCYEVQCAGKVKSLTNLD